MDELSPLLFWILFSMLLLMDEAPPQEEPPPAPAVEEYSPVELGIGRRVFWEELR